jgi:hypothetical protein
MYTVVCYSHNGRQGNSSIDTVCMCVCVCEEEIKLLDFSVEQLPPLIHIREVTFSNPAEKRISTQILVFFPSVPPGKFRDSSSKWTRTAFLPHYVIFINHPPSSVGPCNHSNVRSQAAGEGTAFIYEG